MDEQLAQIYGTGQTDAGEDLEKQAAAELLVKLAAEEGIDLDKCSDEQIAGMISELYKTASDSPTDEQESSESAEPAKEEPKKEEPSDKEAQAKFAEADFLGRVMAHAYVQELQGIEKQALSGAEVLSKIRSGAGRAKELLTGSKLKAFKEDLAGDIRAGRAPKHSAIAEDKRKLLQHYPKEHVFTPSELASHGAKTQDLKYSGSKGLKKLVRGERAKVWGARAGAGAAALTAEEAARRGLKKEKGASALETMIQQRAYELAKEAGYVDEEGNLLVPQVEKQASALDLAVEQEALQLLEANGYPVEWNE